MDSLRFARRIQTKLEALLPTGARVWVRLGDARSAVVEGNPNPTERERESWLARNLESEIQSLFQVEMGDQLLMSVSHTQQRVLVVGVAISSGTRVAGIGVDLESSKRKIEPAVIARIATPEEQQMALPPMAVWTLKEAAFKSDPQNRGAVLGHYRIEAPDRIRGPRGVHTVCAWEDEGYCVALAIALR